MLIAYGWRLCSNLVARRKVKNMCASQSMSARFGLDVARRARFAAVCLAGFAAVAGVGEAVASPYLYAGYRGTKGGVVVIDTATRASGDSLRIVGNFGLPQGIIADNIAFSPDGKKTYMCDLDGNKIWVVDTISNMNILPIDLPSQPDAMAVDADSNKIYVTLRDTNKIAVLSLTTNELVETFSLTGIPDGSAATARGIYLSKTGGQTRLVVGAHAAGILLVDPQTKTVTRQLAPGTTLDYIIPSKDGARIYGYNGGQSADGKLYAVDVASGLEAFSVQMDAKIVALAVSPDSGRAYVGLPSLHQVLAVNTVTTQATMLQLASNQSTYGLEVSADSKKIYALNKGSSDVTVIDAATFAVDSTVGLSSYVKTDSLQALSLGEMNVSVPAVTSNGKTVDGIAFGDVVVGRLSAALHEVQIQNTGTGDFMPNVHISKIWIEGDDFVEKANYRQCSFTLKPGTLSQSGEICTLQLGFGPTAAGLREGKLHISYDEAVKEQVIPLTGTGIGTGGGDGGTDPGAGASSGGGGSIDGLMAVLMSGLLLLGVKRRK